MEKNKTQEIQFTQNSDLDSDEEPLSPKSYAKAKRQNYQKTQALQCSFDKKLETSPSFSNRDSDKSPFTKSKIGNGSSKTPQNQNFTTFTNALMSKRGGKP